MVKEKRSGGSLYWAIVMLIVVAIGAYGTYSRYLSTSGIEHRIISEREYLIESFKETEADYQAGSRARNGKDQDFVQAMITREDNLREVEDKLSSAEVSDKQIDKKRKDLIKLSQAIRVMSENYRKEITQGGQEPFRLAKAQIPIIEALIKSTEITLD